MRSTAIVSQFHYAPLTRLHHAKAATPKCGSFPLCDSSLLLGKMRVWLAILLVNEDSKEVMLLERIF